MNGTLDLAEVLQFLDATVLVYPTLGLFAALTLVWTRALPHVVLRLWFTGTLLASAILLWLLVLAGRVAKLFGASTERNHQIYVMKCIAFAMHVHRVLNPHVQMRKAEGSIDWKTITERHFLLANHTSYFDLFGGLWIVPLSYMTIMRIFFKGSLVSTPILGPMFPEAGNFPVHYTSTKYEDFSVERSKQTEVNEQCDAYLKQGGSLMLAPEGVVNRTPAQLAEFRLGSFALAIKHKMPLYYIVYSGMHEVWPAGAPIGGNPADVLYYIGKLDVNYDEGSPDLDSRTLSLKLKQAMQDRLNVLNEVRSSKKSR